MILFGAVWSVFTMLAMLLPLHFSRRLMQVFLILALASVVGGVLTPAWRFPSFCGSLTFLVLAATPYYLHRQTRQKLATFFRPKRRELWKAYRKIQSEVESDNFEIQRWEESIYVLNRRYDLARHLAGTLDDDDILSYFGGLLTSRPHVSAGAYLKSRPAGFVPEKIWGPRPAEAWLDIARAQSKKLAAAKEVQEYSADPYFRASENLIFWPVYSQDQVHAFIAAAVDSSAVQGFKDELGVYAQILGLGLRRSELYKMVLARSRLDGMTGLYLRRVLEERLKEEILLSKRYGTSFSLMILDLDRFKTVNDTYGHPIGDQILKQAAQRLKELVHSGVMVFRYGGEEFAILVGLAPREEVLLQAEKIRSRFDSEPFQVGGFFPLKLTVSVGIAHFRPEMPSIQEFIRRADESLYRAKRNGRNQIHEWRR